MERIQPNFVTWEFVKLQIWYDGETGRKSLCATAGASSTIKTKV